MNEIFKGEDVWADEEDGGPDSQASTYRQWEKRGKQRETKEASEITTT